MRILLPPSETKRSGGGGVFAPELLAHHEALAAARKTVRSALVRVSRNQGAATQALKLGVKSHAERLHNLELDTSGAMPAIERYTGVLYDALDAQSLDASARAWIDTHVSIQSALFGAIRADNLIPAYRMSASSRLPTLKIPLATLWRNAHAAIDWSVDDWLLDLRSLDYVALAPLPENQGSYLHVTQRTEDGEIRALNHFNKAAKGALVRQLATTGADITSASDFQCWAEVHGIEVSLTPGDSAMTLTLPATSQPAATLNR